MWVREGVRGGGGEWMSWSCMMAYPHSVGLCT